MLSLNFSKSNGYASVSGYIPDFRISIHFISVDFFSTIRERTWNSPFFLTPSSKLTSGLVHSLIERIEVHNNDKYDGHCHVKVDIYFSVIGMMDIPDEKEIQAMMDEVQKNPQKYRYVA